MQNSNISPEQQQIIEEIKAKEERARNMLGTSADFVDEGKIDEMYVDKLIKASTTEEIDANTRALVQALGALNDQLVLINRAMSIMLQQQNALIQIQSQQAGKLQMPRSPIVGLK